MSLLHSFTLKEEKLATFNMHMNYNIQYELQAISMEENYVTNESDNSSSFTEGVEEGVLLPII